LVRKASILAQDVVSKLDIQTRAELTVVGPAAFMVEDQGPHPWPSPRFMPGEGRWQVFWLDGEEERTVDFPIGIYPRSRVVAMAEVGESSFAETTFVQNLRHDKRTQPKMGRATRR
jgi:hypothetical protein